MTIQEALKDAKDGRIIKRVDDWDDLAISITSAGYLVWADGSGIAAICIEDIFADDWEIKQ
jgi:hypothetical protein